MHGPDPATPYPMAGFPRTVFLKNVITRSNIEVGEFSYYDDPDGAERFEDRNVLYHFEFLGDRLKIGRFVAIAHGATFIMNGANHLMTGFSTFPFNIFGNGWEEGFDGNAYLAQSRGDTFVGNDVWIGRQAQIMPGVTIGDGAVIGAHAVVASNIPPYAVAVGNPARVLRMRFDPETVETLLGIAWWEWPVAKISRNLAAIRGADLSRLKSAR